MTDIITLGLGLDTSKFAQGAQQAATALGPVETKLASTRAASQRFEGTLKEVTKAASGTSQVARGLGDFAKAMSEGAGAAAAFTAVGLGIEIAKTADDFKDLTDAVKQTGEVTQVAEKVYDDFGIATTRVTTATNTATRASSALWTVLKANPLIAVSAAITAIGVAMSLFSSNTKKAVVDLEALKLSAEGIKARIATSKDFSKELELAALKQQQSRLFDAAVDFRVAGQPVPFRNVIQSSGLSPSDFVNLDPNSRGRITPEQAAAIVEGDRSSPRTFQLGQATLSPEAVGSTYGSLYNALGGRINEIEGGLKSEEEQKSKLLKAQSDALKENLMESNKELEEMVQKAEQLGATLGNAWIDFLTGAADANTILRNLLIDVARQQVTSWGAAAFGSLAGRVAGSATPTPAEATTPGAAPSGWGATNPFGPPVK